MKFNQFILLTILLFSCQQKKKENVESIVELEKKVELKKTKREENKIIELEKRVIGFDTINIFPKDTIINSWNLTFKQINESDFKAQIGKQVITSFEQDNTSEFLIRKDSCYYLTLNSKEKDTLCDFDDGEYHEKYSLKGFSKQTNTLIFDWENWEEAHSILINLNENKHWILCPEYEISPDQSWLTTFSNYIDNPIYEENELFLYELTENSVTEICRFSNENYGVFAVRWTDANTILIELKKVDYESFKATESYFFELTKTLYNTVYN
ncbi:MAG: hypothetical protein ABJD55_12595 [Flavobacteriaceae bacterium]